jgi:calcineurin-like phosphoesterase family protein
MWHFIADPHLAHSNIIKYCQRPFLDDAEKECLKLVKSGQLAMKDFRVSEKSTQKMTDTIIDSINATVYKKDHLVIAGDFCSWKDSDLKSNVAKSLRDRINCSNVYLIVGNHDRLNLKNLIPLFVNVYDHYTFEINGQSVFVDHYPNRSWDKAHYGTWMLYGHVHNLYSNEDNGKLMPYENLVLRSGFDSILEKISLDFNQKNKVLEDLISVCESLKGIDLTLDVGVDNRIRGESVPFGTPWSMDDISAYMGKKMSRWLQRQKVYKELSK